MTKDEIRNIQLAIHDLINKEQYDQALPLIYSVLEEYPNDEKGECGLPGKRCQ